MRLLVVEDDATLRRYIVRLLREEGFVIDEAAKADEGRFLGLTNDYDGIVLDLDLPDGHGADVIRAIRGEKRPTPILVFSGRSDSEEVIEALDAGADDYVVKPAGGSMIRARVRALVRRGQHHRTWRSPNQPLTVGNVSLNIANRRVQVAGKPIQLTPTETQILQQLMLRVGEVVSRTELLEKVWDMTFDPESNVVDTHVSRLRTKLKNAGADVAVTGVRNTGFLMEPEAAAG